MQMFNVNYHKFTHLSCETFDNSQCKYTALIVGSNLTTISSHSRQFTNTSYSATQLTERPS